ncbi:MAG: 4-alpha-glucanotransferase [Steroidobacteraceae bacterium]
MNDSLLDAWSKALGLARDYLDFRGERRPIDPAIRAAILEAMGLDWQAAPPEPGTGWPVGQPDGETVRASQPRFLAAGGRSWGLSIQLYTLRSRDNWGIGDFGDLADLARLAAGAGADFIGLNPLHALFAADPGHCSPYSASSRHCLNVLYIAVERVPGFAQCPQAVAQVGAPAFRKALQRLRRRELVDYVAVAGRKLPVLRLLYEQFRREEWLAGTPRGRDFAHFLQMRSETVGAHALFEAIDAEMRRQHRSLGGWVTWPDEYIDPDAPAVQAFAAAHEVEIGFHAWLQWTAEAQLAEAQRVAREYGMRIGLYGDYAVGVNPGGSEVWANRSAYCVGASFGAPPDALALKGQDWGLPPPDPRRLAELHGAPFRALMRDNMRHFGALRLDHVMALYRLWWVPRGRSAAEGGYVHYPVQMLFDIVAEESARSGCMVIGEDLGTVPPEVRGLMEEAGVHGYLVLYFERDAGGAFRQPRQWRRDALASVTTHDLPTLKAWWEATDIDLRARLGMYPPDLDVSSLKADRATDRERLIDALAGAGTRPRWPVDAFEADFAAAIHAFLASSASALVAVQAEDLLGMEDPVNIPGTWAEYANWRRKLSADLAALVEGDSARPILEALRRHRPR